MSLRLDALVIDAHDPPGLAGFWSGVLGWTPTGDGLTLEPGDDTGFLIRFRPTRAPKTGPNQVHTDLTSTSLEAQEQTVARVLELGGRHLDVGQGPEESHVVLADPEGNELCVIEPGNGFLAGCPFLGALSSDGTQAVGYFWSAALGWPLVWDQDEETAIQAPHGGPKISWGGPPVNVKTGKNRWHLDLAPDDGSDQATEVARLVALGATPTDIGQGSARPGLDPVVLADPDGNELCVLAGP
ncbi:VOC family protein [Nocardioides dongxiaopingii]|uniref:VOC family protein n=1 Tax=Nocardioides dongxiaopingii TaxID=2576036 RepID=UPI0010C76B45|nr:VOC family protein [Nocardioides dongxiaopingii]